MASVIGCASASHCSAVSRSAWPPSSSASLVSRLAIGAVAAMPAAIAEHLVEERLRLEDPRDQPEPQRLVGVDHAAGEQQVAGVRLADHSGSR